MSAALFSGSNFFFRRKNRAPRAPPAPRLLFPDAPRPLAAHPDPARRSRRCARGDPRRPRGCAGGRGGPGGLRGPVIESRLFHAAGACLAIKRTGNAISDSSQLRGARSSLSFAAVPSAPCCLTSPPRRPRGQGRKLILEPLGSGGRLHALRSLAGRRWMKAFRELREQSLQPQCHRVRSPLGIHPGRF